ncbi:MAG: NAD-dependent epimerase/dehydratase family protein [Sulfuricurvum sp.]|nr:NAD-dependent epimerase/dehydratase family protein [Sulfuricurvum sp.]
MITIIGGSGFIGTRLCKRLEHDGVDFTIVDKVTSKTFGDKTAVADVRDYNGLVKACDGDVIINLAAEHRDDVSPKSLYDEVNVDGARRVCEVAEQKGIHKIIFTSSVAVYGFAPLGTDESGEINYFNDYGRTKYEAELIYKAWQEKDPTNRTLVIVRPTVVFGEQNRGNVYNLLRQIASGKFMMIGDGTNRKSMAYVENIAAFLEYSLKFENGVHIYNYIDKPDFDMNTLVAKVNKALGKDEKIGFRMPFVVGYSIGKVFDLVAAITGKKLTVSSIRVKKFCSDSMFDTSVAKSGFVPPVKLEDGLASTIKYEFVDKNEGELFYSE